MRKKTRNDFRTSRSPSWKTRTPSWLMNPGIQKLTREGIQVVISQHRPVSISWITSLCLVSQRRGETSAKSQLAFSSTWNWWDRIRIWLQQWASILKTSQSSRITHNHAYKRLPRSSKSNCLIILWWSGKRLIARRSNLLFKTKDKSSKRCQTWCKRKTFQSRTNQSQNPKMPRLMHPPSQKHRFRIQKTSQSRRLRPNKQRKKSLLKSSKSSKKRQLNPMIQLLNP